jgi:peptide/nickel transport system permease protein
VPRRGVLRSILTDPGLLTGILIVGLVLVAALAAPLAAAIVGHGPNDQFPDETLDASGLPITGGNGFLLGADGSGRDVFIRVLYGARISLLIGVPATTIAMLIGVVVGLIGGYFGGRVDAVLSEVTNVALAFPFLVTALSVVTLNRGTAGTTLVDPIVVVTGIIALFSWTYFARLVRKTVIIYWAVQLPANIVAEASLSYLGVGIKAPTPSWGTMIANAQDSALYQTQPLLLIAPAGALFVTVLGFNLLSTRLRSRFDPLASR